MDGANAVDSFVVSSKKTPPDDTTLVYNALQVAASWSTGERCRRIRWLLCQWHLAGTILQRNGNIQRRRDDVSVWELVEKIDPPIHTESEQPP